ncbi:hypothetical protein EZV62_011523 [Acer yangbiense]|uniref:YqgF/RNase H-like domain-containing protein n=1 Tax=Acer yangbiense TaxID=1000413 RepID=A0A5C7I6U2_9ROSI|nr:hypothetical protein EZV62_011523 [Acer yangbiense]
MRQRAAHPRADVGASSSQPSNHQAEVDASSLQLPTQMRYECPFHLFAQVLMRKQLSKTKRKASEWGLGHFLGLDVYQNHVSLAVSDPDNRTAFSLSPLDRKKYNNMDAMANELQTLISKYNVEGFVFGIPSHYDDDKDYQYYLGTDGKIFIDGLCDTRKFEGLTYTVWEKQDASKLVESMLKVCNTPEEVAKNVITRSSALSILQKFLKAANSRPPIEKLRIRD